MEVYVKTQKGIATLYGRRCLFLLDSILTMWSKYAIFSIGNILSIGKGGIHLDIAKDLFYAGQTLAALFSVTNKLQMQGDKHLQDITIRQMLAIPALVHAPGGKATINHLARSMGTTKQSAKQIVDAMERKGYLSVAPSEQDRRAVNVTVTPEGKKAFGICSERTDEFLANIFCNFSSEELETLCVLLQKLYHFDGAMPERFAGHVGYDASASDDILRHHQSFAKLREKAKESE